MTTAAKLSKLPVFDYLEAEYQLYRNDNAATTPRRAMSIEDIVWSGDIAPTFWEVRVDSTRVAVLGLDNQGWFGVRLNSLPERALGTIKTHLENYGVFNKRQSTDVAKAST